MAAKNVEKIQPSKPQYAAILDPHYVWLSIKDLIKEFGKSKSFWYSRRKNSNGPPFFTWYGKTIMYRRDLVIDWMNSGLCTSLSDENYKQRKMKAPTATLTTALNGVWPSNPHHELASRSEFLRARIG